MNVHVTGRHFVVTDPIRDYALKKLEHIGLSFPRVIDAHVILEVQKHRHICEVVLACANHIHIEASEESEDMYASIDLCVDKLARQMRKYKTKIQRHHRERKHKPVHVEEHVLSPEGMDEHEEAEPKMVHKESYLVKPLYPDEAVLQMELSPRQFLIFMNPATEQINVMYRRKNGEYGLVEPNVPKKG
ncbi:MAG: ribosome-associated translation inhibitor RaiA [Verrucomicrobiae bacterium]|nr:ribosome-associated translation inhibitor RaiA [Verrucomicrobiae bacterium]